MTHPDPRGAIFLDPTLYADQERWHATAAELRAEAPVLRVEEEGYTPFWAVTRHEDVFAVSRDNEHFLNTRNSIVAPDMQMAFLASIGIEGETLIHMDGKEHADHRGPGQRLVPAAGRGQAAGVDRGGRRRVRREVPRDGRATATSPRTSPSRTPCA